MLPLHERGPWRLVLALLAVPVGAGLQLQQTRLAGPEALAALLFAAGVLAVAAVRLQRRRGWQIALTTLAVALAAFAVTDGRAQLRRANVLPADLEGVDLVLTGVVTGLPRLGPEGTSFDFAVESARMAGQPVAVAGEVRLSWMVGWDGESLLASPPTPLLAGDRWRLTARLKRPHGALNPHGFDVELWMFERGLNATGTVRPSAVRLGRSWHKPWDRWRQAARDAVLVQVADAKAAGVLAALAVGDQASIDQQDWDLFRVTGVAHLMSISGLHITMFAWIAAAALLRVWRWMPRAGLWLPAPEAARWGGLLLAAAYAVLTGWGVPAQRTVWMLATVVLVRSRGRRWPWPLIWLTSGAVVVAVDPWALLQPGFWLSFVAVGVLMASEPASSTVQDRSAFGPLESGLRTQLVATAALAPLSLVFFNQVSLVGLVANLLAVPWVTWVVTPLALLGLLWAPLWSLGAVCIEGLITILSGLAAFPSAAWSAAAAPVWAAVAGILGGLLLIMPVPWRLRWLGLPLMVPLLLPVPPLPATGEVHIVAVDVGQGTAVLVRTRQHLLVYDSGPRYTPQSDAGGRHLLPLLRARGDRAVDRLVLSHRDTDHIGGAASLLEGVPVLDTLSSLEDDHALRPRLPQHQRCVAGQQWTWDGVRFEVLHPRAADYERPAKPNALSCVIRVIDRHGPRLLLTGDIEAEQELALVSTWGREALNAAVLMLPHHGSRTSSTQAFLAAVSPDVAVAQAAYRSRYGHPAPDVEQRVADAGAALVRSDRCGAWQWPGEVSTSATPEAAHSRLERPIAVPPSEGSCERERRRRYWHHSGPG